MQVVIFSFGFKHGPPAADSVWDIRFLPNPYYVPGLKDKTGLDPDVAAYVLNSDTAHDFFPGFEPFLETFLARHAASGRDSICLAVGCTGGRHRSVAVVEHLGKFLRDNNYTVRVYHRDIEKQ